MLNKEEKIWLCFLVIKLGGGETPQITYTSHYFIIVRWGRLRMISASTGAGTIAQLYDDLSQIAKSEHPATLNYGRYFSGYTNDGSNRLAIAILDQQSYNAFGKNGFIIYKNGSVASSSDTTSAQGIGQYIWFTD